MPKARSALKGLLACSILLTVRAVPAAALLDDSADARTRAVFDYLQSQYGKKMLTGCWTEAQYGGAQAFHACTGEWPAIFGQDMNSWYKSRTDKLWSDTWAGSIAQFQTAWGRHEILQVNWHWQNVAHKDADGAYTDDAWSSLTAQEWADIVTPGTALYDAMIEDVDYHVANFLKKLADASGPIPILFRPLHEIDGGWFWWTCKTDPAKTAKLYGLIQDRIIKHHHMHNLIWIYNPGVLCDGGSWPPYAASEYPRRRAFYVGDARCDLVGIDLYDWDWTGKGTYAPNGTDYGKTYRDAWNTMKAITTAKMIALSECQGLPDPAKSFSDSAFAPWLYALPWFANEANGVSCSVLSPRAGSPYMVNAGALPDFSKVSALAPGRKRAAAGWPVARGKASLWIAPLGDRANGAKGTDAAGKIVLIPIGAPAGAEDGKGPR